MANTFDYIIIGAGTAGCVLANRLSLDHTVLLIEAGGRDTKPEIHIPAAYTKLNKTRVDWSYWGTPQSKLNNRRIYLPRGKVMGGCSSTNAMAYVRGHRLDYDEWEQLGNKGWGYEELLPYFMKSEDNAQLSNEWHQQGGELHVSYRPHTILSDTFVEACESTGIARNPDCNGNDHLGAGLLQFNIKNGKRHSAAVAFIKPILDRKNLTIITHAHVKKILVKDQRAIGIEVLTGKNTTQKFHVKEEVLLAAGAFNSPQVLMLSGIGSKEELGRHRIPLVHELEGVGQNLQDHLFTGVGSWSKSKVGLNHQLTLINQMKSLFQFMANKSGPLTGSPLEANAFVNLNKTTQDRTDFQFHFVPLHLGESSVIDLYDIKSFPTNRDGYTILPILLKPKSRGSVNLQSADPKATPVIDHNFLSEDEDAATLLKGTKMAIEIVSQTPFNQYREKIITPPLRTSDDEIMAHIKLQTETLYHPVGTCKMGHDSMSVVDDELKVHGLSGIRVIDASIMPIIIAGNTNATVVMIAEKAADMILKGKK